MNVRWTVVAMFCAVVLLTTSPSIAQFGSGGGGYPDGASGLSSSGLGGGMMMSGMGMAPAAPRGVPTDIDLKDATLGQVVDALEPSSVRGENNERPLNILISDKLRQLKVGTLKLNDMYPRSILEAISKLTESSFYIEEVAEGQVLILRPAGSAVVVKAIRLPWLELSAPQLHESVRAENERNIQIRLAELMRAIEETFHIHQEVSGRTLPAPQIQTQKSLSMVIVIGSPESVTIATEIINATNPDYVPAPTMGMPGGGGGAIGGGSGGGFFSIPENSMKSDIQESN